MEDLFLGLVLGVKERQSKNVIISLFECELLRFFSSSVTLDSYFNSDYGLISLHKSETMKWLCCFFAFTKFS